MPEVFPVELGLRDNVSGRWVKRAAAPTARMGAHPLAVSIGGEGWSMSGRAISQIATVGQGGDGDLSRGEPP